MADRSFSLVCTVSTEKPAAVRPVLVSFVGRSGTVEDVAPALREHGGKGEFLVRAEIAGASAKDLNRSLLTALRKAEKRTRLRAEWVSEKTAERYFDYVLKKTTAL